MISAQTHEPEGRAATDDARLVARLPLCDLTAEEGVVLDAFLPEVLAGVARVEVELDRVLVVALPNKHTRTVRRKHAPHFRAATTSRTTSH